eukprot:TRINITY_DN305_c0_g1_i2.p1 TRINITY_DN305_c0_g1~~TRINITY_DN305_c0_g1_i2.p1  ORF type:complete len:1091 (+),score=394.62 TRINITY_DN305_c0_g1_i2:706-3978(+)
MGYFWKRQSHRRSDDMNRMIGLKRFDEPYGDDSAFEDEHLPLYLPQKPHYPSSRKQPIFVSMGGGGGGRGQYALVDPSEMSGQMGVSNWIRGSASVSNGQRDDSPYSISSCCCAFLCLCSFCVLLFAFILLFLSFGLIVFTSHGGKFLSGDVNWLQFLGPNANFSFIPTIPDVVPGGGTYSPPPLSIPAGWESSSNGGAAPVVSQPSETAQQQQQLPQQQEQQQLPSQPKEQESVQVAQQEQPQQLPAQPQEQEAVQVAQQEQQPLPQDTEQQLPQQQEPEEEAKPQQEQQQQQQQQPEQQQEEQTQQPQEESPEQQQQQQQQGQTQLHRMQPQPEQLTPEQQLQQQQEAEQVSQPDPPQEVPQQEEQQQDVEQQQPEQQLPEEQQQQPLSEQQVPAEQQQQQLPEQQQQQQVAVEQQQQQAPEQQQQQLTTEQQQQQLPAEQQQLPAEQQQVPAEQQQLPAEQQQLPAEQQQVPAEQQQLPFQQPHEALPVPQLSPSDEQQSHQDQQQQQVQQQQQLQSDELQRQRDEAEAHKQQQLQQYQADQAAQQLQQQQLYDKQHQPGVLSAQLGQQQQQAQQEQVQELRNQAEQQPQELPQEAPQEVSQQLPQQLPQEPEQLPEQPQVVQSQEPLPVATTQSQQEFPQPPDPVEPQQQEQQQQPQEVEQPQEETQQAQVVEQQSVEQTLPQPQSEEVQQQQGLRSGVLTQQMQQMQPVEIDQLPVEPTTQQEVEQALTEVKEDELLPTVQPSTDAALATELPAFGDFTGTAAQAMELYKRYSMVIYMPYHTEDAWPYLFNFAPFRSICTRKSAYRRYDDDEDATDVLPVLKDEAYGWLLLEYGAMFTVDIMPSHTRFNKKWIGFQHWQTRQRGLELSLPALQKFNTLLQTSDETDVFYYWVSLGEQDMYRNCDDVFGVCSLVISSTLKELFTPRDVLGGVDVVTLEKDARFLPPMPGIDRGFATSTSWVMHEDYYHAFIKFMRMFFVTMESLWDLHDKPDECPLSMEKAGEPKTSCWTFIMERVVNIWAYHSGLKFRFIDPATGAVYEQYPLDQRDRWPHEFSEPILTSLAQSFPFRLSTQSSQLYKDLGGKDL